MNSRANQGTKRKRKGKEKGVKKGSVPQNREKRKGVEQPRKMKTIRVLLLMALGWLALPASVWAFYNPSTGRWLSRDPINERGFNLLIRNPSLFNREEEKSPYGVCNNNPLTNIDPDGREIVTVAITVWSLGKGISHLICGFYYCKEAMKCRDRAQELLNNATPGLQSTDAETALKWAEWLRAARPGQECGELWSACGKEAVLTASWVVGGYIVKYGIRYAKGYGKPDP